MQTCTSLFNPYKKAEYKGKKKEKKKKRRRKDREHIYTRTSKTTCSYRNSRCNHKLFLLNMRNPLSEFGILCLKSARHLNSPTKHNSFVPKLSAFPG
jgi:hypothetical protein